MDGNGFFVGYMEVADCNFNDLGCVINGIYSAVRKVVVQEMDKRTGANTDK